MKGKIISDADNFNNFSARKAHRIATQEAQPHLNTQFPIQFADGTVIYQQPHLMKKSATGLPILDPEGYLRGHHPERLKELQDFKKRREQQFQSWGSSSNSYYPFR